MSLKEVIKEALPESLLHLLRAYRYRRKRPENFRAYQDAVRGKAGVEIGGPSAFFRYVLPLYPVIQHLDGVNFSGETMWEGVIQAGHHFEYMPGRVGRQFIAEATGLREIETGRYQFLLSSNCLEHVANPLKALEEWVRVVEPGGFLLLVLPNQVANFDHRRPVTQFEHLLDDYQRRMSEADMTHLPEVLALHDLARDPWAGSRESFVQRCQENVKYRGLHHHVFDLALMERALLHWGVTPLLRNTTETDFVILGQTARAA